MTTMRLSLNLLESDSQIKQQILESIRDVLDSAIAKSLNKIQQQFKIMIVEAIKREPEYMSLKNGQLRYELVIADSSMIDRAVDEICEGQLTRSPVKATSRGVSGGVKYIIIGADKVDRAMEGSNGLVQDAKGYTLPWLKWILTKGTATIVKNFDVKLGPNPNSRTGMAIMVESSESWSVPAQFAGISDNNWITRAIDNINENNLYQIIQSNIESNI